jgi:hypothetical protein
MDSNLFEYLIIIFFVVSAIQSFFGKKKKQQQKERQTQERAGASRPQRTEAKKESAQEILEQLFGLKIPEEKPKQTKTPSGGNTDVLDPSGYHDTSWNPEEEYEDSIGVETVRYENNDYNKWNTNSEYVEPAKKVDSKTSAAQKIMGKIPTKMEVEEVGTVSTEEIQFVQRIRNNISNPDSIREYILVSEILNKPKALRK